MYLRIYLKLKMLKFLNNFRLKKLSKCLKTKSGIIVIVDVKPSVIFTSKQGLCEKKKMILKDG